MTPSFRPDAKVDRPAGHEGCVMTRMKRASVVASTVVAIVLLAGAAFAAGDPALRRIVVFPDGTPTDIQTQVITASGSRLLRALPIVNGVSIALPALDSAAALTFLQTHPAVSG